MDESTPVTKMSDELMALASSALLVDYLNNQLGTGTGGTSPGGVGDDTVSE